MTKKKGPHLHSHRFTRRRGDSRELAERLAPLEELLPYDSNKSATPVDSSQLVAQENGTIVVGREKLTLPEDIVDVSERKQTLGLEPVVLVIVGLFLAFIAFIAWLVSRMPLQTN